MDDPPFKLGEPRYDQSTFQGRLRHFFDIVDPRTLFTTKKQLQEAIELLDKVKKNESLPGVTNSQLWEAQKIKQAIIHPDTNEKIFMPCRMSGFVPFGSVTVIGLLLPNQTLAQMVFWQWINQSHNACVNYSNRNAGKNTDYKKFVAGYIGAITSACSIAVGLSILLKRSNAFRPATKMMIQRFVPYPAVATASVSNLYLMRRNELKEGIEVKNSKDEVVGTSFVAARRAVTETAVTRAFLPAPILVVPPMLMTLLERMSFMRRFPGLFVPIQSVVTVACFGIALPIAIALFPQTTQIETGKLEKEIQDQTDESVLFYNKGL
ncbi:sideroflexin-5-like [Dysidea avara]|uniref:sideroflexin-5-like n=1 Tax=Dysidea avara TaxID=196820 RepID=UPI003325DB96